MLFKWMKNIRVVCGCDWDREGNIDKPLRNMGV